MEEGRVVYGFYFFGFGLENKNECLVMVLFMFGIMFLEVKVNKILVGV